MTRLDESWVGQADPRYEAFHGMFGGWTAALALAAVENDAEPDRAPGVLAVNFLAPVTPGSQVRIRTHRLGGGGSVSHWSAEQHRSDTGDTLSTATVVLVARRPTDGHMQVAMPDVPQPETLEEWHPPMAAGQRIDVRPVQGHPAFGRMDTRSLEWVRETSGRPMDRVQLGFLVDACSPRSFFWSDGPRLSATLAMTVYFHATDDELALVGDDYVLNEVTGTRGNASIADQSLRTWSRHGVLLASSHQLCSYR